MHKFSSIVLWVLCESKWTYKLGRIVVLFLCWVCGGNFRTTTENAWIFIRPKRNKKKYIEKRNRMRWRRKEKRCSVCFHCSQQRGAPADCHFSHFHCVSSYIFFYFVRLWRSRCCYISPVDPTNRTIRRENSQCVFCVLDRLDQPAVGFSPLPNRFSHIFWPCNSHKPRCSRRQPQQPNNQIK